MNPGPPPCQSGTSQPSLLSRAKSYQARRPAPRNFFDFLTVVKNVVCLRSNFLEIRSIKLERNFLIRYLLINGHGRKLRQRGDRLDALCPFLLSSNAGDPGLGHQLAILLLPCGEQSAGNPGSNPGRRTPLKKASL